MKQSQSSLVLTALLSTLLTTTTYAASKGHQASKLAQATYDAREKCISDTLAALPGTPQQGNGLSTRRMNMYSECAKRMGFRP